MARAQVLRWNEHGPTLFPSHGVCFFRMSVPGYCGLACGSPLWEVVRQEAALPGLAWSLAQPEFTA